MSSPDPRTRPLGLDEELISSLIPAVSKSHRKLAGALLHDLGLAAGQQFVLMLLWDEPPTAAKMLARLERAGFVARERSATDRRVVLVSLTDAGRALQEPVTSVWQRLEEMTTTSLTPEETAQLRGLLVRVAGDLATASDGLPSDN